MALSIYVIGVCGAGKSVIGADLADALGGTFIEGDAYHHEQNVEKMRRGEPLTDDDRWPWLTALAKATADAAHPDRIAVTACSGLKKRYRELLRSHTSGATCFVFLDGTRDLIASRMQRRKGHYMPVSLLDSQLATLEPPHDEPQVLTINIDQSPADIVAEILNGLRSIIANSTVDHASS